METVLTAMKRLGRANASEIAAVLKIDRNDALALLKEQAESGLVECVNGHWELTAAGPIITGGAVAGRLIPSPSAHSGIGDFGSDALSFPTTRWIQQQKRLVKSELRWLESLEAISRQVGRKKKALAYFRERA